MNTTALAHQLLLDFLREIIKADPMDREALLDTYTQKLEALMAQKADSHYEY